MYLTLEGERPPIINNHKIVDGARKKAAWQSANLRARKRSVSPGRRSDKPRYGEEVVGQKSLDLSGYDEEDLESYFSQLFEMADVNGDGVVDAPEAATLLKLCGFKLRHEQVEAIVERADVDGDGVIQYGEFVPMILGLLRAPV